jgi:hypothetical protein
LGKNAARARARGGSAARPAPSRRLAQARAGFCAALALALVGWVLPPERVVHEMARIRARQGPIRAEAALVGVDSRWPEELRIELHPEHGVRISDDRGGRWLLREGRVVGRNRDAVPPWIPDLEILVIREEEALLRWLEMAQVDTELSQFARWGEADCFVLGGRKGEAQLWVEKGRFEVRRVLWRRGRRLDLGAYQEWDTLRFPGEIRVEDSVGPIATLQVVEAAWAPDLSSEDFTPEWALFDRARGRGVRPDEPGAPLRRDSTLERPGEPE